MIVSSCVYVFLEVNVGHEVRDVIYRGNYIS